jgi:hypothetical protein
MRPDPAEILIGMRKSPFDYGDLMMSRIIRQVDTWMVHG